MASVVGLWDGERLSGRVCPSILHHLHCLLPFASATWFCHTFVPFRNVIWVFLFHLVVPYTFVICFCHQFLSFFLWSLAIHIFHLILLLLSPCAANICYRNMLFLSVFATGICFYHTLIPFVSYLCVRHIRCLCRSPSISHFQTIFLPVIW